MDSCLNDRLVAMKASTPTLSQHKWLKDCNLRQNDINWSAAYQLASKITKSTKLREFHFRLSFCIGDYRQMTS